MSILHSLEIETWTGPFSDDLRADALASVERGKVLVLPRLPFALEDDEKSLMSPALSNGKSKNIGLRSAGRLSGTSATGETARLLQKMIGRFARTATNFVSELLPSYAGRLERSATSYRPVEIAGRSASAVHDDRRLHVDAFPSRPMRGRRIMRLFTNVNPSGASRVWHVGEPFAEMAQRFLAGAKEGSAVHAWLLAAIGVTKGRRSAYDNLMLALHDGAKRDEFYQRTAPQAEIAFAPGTTWICYTDQVMHAALAGQFVLEQTFHLDVNAMAEPALSPLKVLERMRGHKLV